MSREQIEEMEIVMLANDMHDLNRKRSVLDWFWIAEQLYKAGYRKQEWVSVDERLPENYNDCLLFLDNEQIVIGWYHASAKAFVEGGIALINEVTHWMPLPEAPKMKGGAE